MTDRVSVLLVDDHALVRAGLAALLEGPLDARVTKALLPTAGLSDGSGLSPREREVLDLVSQGMANKQIPRAGDRGLYGQGPPPQRLP